MQVFENGQVGIITFRGSTTKTSSWIENMYTAMIPATGIVILDGEKLPYKFASDTAAAVHSGYALAVMLLKSTIIDQINKLNAKGIYDILLTGHSQGVALAHLTHA
jgi:hypothetical protein